VSDTESMDGDVSFLSNVDVSALPKVVKDRVKALKKLQHWVLETEAEYYKELHALGLKYQKLYDAINEQRHQVITGKYEPAGDDIDWPSDEENEDEDKEVAKVEKNPATTDYGGNTKGIPKFWFHVLRNANEECLSGLMEPRDEPVLEHLTDITLNLSEPNNTGFSITFHFAPENPFFTNSTLIKQYVLRDGPDPEAPLEYDGPEIISCKGCTIEWKEGKDVTKSTCAEGEASVDSFFSFFSPPEDGKSEEDFAVGFAIKEKVVPRAVLWFTGEIVEDDDDWRTTISRMRGRAWTCVF